jgi:hypothetical protein
VNYFENLESRIWARIKSNYQTSEKTNPSFSLPEFYFQKLENKILNRIALDNTTTENEEAFLELSAPTLFGIERKLPFKIPLGYFSTFEKKNSELIATDGIPDEDLSSQIIEIVGEKQNFFQVPKEYFYNLDQEIIGRIAAECVIEDLEDLYFTEKAELLFSTSRANPFLAPKGYFENFEVGRPNKILTRPTETRILKGKLISLQTIKNTIVSIAALMVIYFGVYYLITPKVASVEIGELQVTGAEILESAKTDPSIQFDEDDIVSAFTEYVDFETVALNPMDEKVSNSEIVDYLLENNLDEHSLEL